MWHACGTVKMGKLSEPGTCVDKDFKLVGVQNLRVVDMSVAPFLPRYVSSFSRPFRAVYPKKYSASQSIRGSADYLLTDVFPFIAL